MLKFEDFINSIESPQIVRNKKLINKVFEFAAKKHEGQFRKVSGEPYFTHPISVAILLKKFDDQIICAGLLHDVLEDTETTPEELINEFGRTITYLVEGMTKNPGTKDILDALSTVAQIDRRVIYVKLADRCDNMSDGILQMKTSTLEKYLVETPRIQELARNFDIDFLEESLIYKLKLIEEHLQNPEVL